MKATDFFTVVIDGHNRRVELLGKKGSDYGQIDEDILSSFKKVAIMSNALEIDGCTTFTGSGIATILLNLKLVRDANLKSSGRPVQNESRLDTTDDMHNYIDLKTANEIDEKEQEK